MAEVTRTRNTVTGAEWEAPTESLAAWRSLGWEPITGQSRTRDDADLERIEADESDAAHVEEVAALVATDDPPTVAVILEEVGDDPAAAQVALDAEQARPKPRITLVDRLTQITPTAGDAGTTKEN